LTTLRLVEIRQCPSVRDWNRLLVWRLNTGFDGLRRGDNQEKSGMALASSKCLDTLRNCAFGICRKRLHAPGNGYLAVVGSRFHRLSPSDPARRFFVGLGPAILTSVLSGIVLWYVFLPPFYSFGLGPPGFVGLATFAIGSATGITLVHWLRILIEQAEAERTRSETLAVSVTDACAL
jgi:hypothetical protein